MTRRELARLLDHAVLKPEAPEAEILAGAETVRRWAIGFYCVQPCWVALAAEALRGADATVIGVIGFPHGLDRALVKAEAAALAVKDGAGEIDMVMNVGLLRSGHAAAVAEELGEVVHAVAGTPVKVIIEAGALDDRQKVQACHLIREAGAAFVKTSTGFHPSGGATLADVRLLRATVGPALGVKASGGIRTLADATAMLEAGASRLGTSSSATILGALAG